MIKTQKIEYREGETLLEGFYAYDDSIKNRKPAVLVAHDWSGRNEFACMKAEKLAELGYVGFALDMYGKGVLGSTTEEKSALIQPLMADRALLLRRMLAGLETVKQLEQVHAHQIAAIGFCFGGLCALDLARSGADIKAVVSFHGLLLAPERMQAHPIKAKILALHGFDDPMVTHEHIIRFGEEMTQAKVDWQFHIYGNAMHAFTNPKANDPVLGTVYHNPSDTRSWIEMTTFLKETLV